MLRCTQDKERQQILQLNDLNLEKFGTFSSEKPAIVMRDYNNNLFILHISK